MSSRRITKAALAALLVAGAFTARAAVLPDVLGPTYPIAEKDFEQEIREKAGGIDWKKTMQKDPKTWSALQSHPLPRATKTGTRLFDPTYHLLKDITDPTGRVIFPKGYAVNVYTRIKVTGRYIVIQPTAEDYRWLDEVAKPRTGDKVLIAGGNVMEERMRTHRPLYILDERFIERFGLQTVPAIVQQEGTSLRVNEFYVPLNGGAK